MWTVWCYVSEFIFVASSASQYISLYNSSSWLVWRGVVESNKRVLWGSRAQCGLARKIKFYVRHR